MSFKRDFTLACLGWQVKPCHEYDAVSEDAHRLFSELGCSHDLQFSDAVWERPELMTDPAWCRHVTEWIEATRAWAGLVQPWGWRGPKNGPGLLDRINAEGVGRFPTTRTVVEQLPPRPQLQWRDWQVPQ